MIVDQKQKDIDEMLENGHEWGSRWLINFMANPEMPVVGSGSSRERRRLERFDVIKSGHARSTIPVQGHSFDAHYSRKIIF